MIERFSDNEPEAGIHVIRAVAQDLHEREIPLWDVAGLSVEALCHRSGDRIITGFIGGTAVAAMVFTDWDPEFWPEIPRGESTFVHKLAVLPSFQGKGLGKEMLEYAMKMSLAVGIHVTRLDCAADRPKLCAVYEAAGYMKISERMVGKYPTAFYERAIQPDGAPDALGAVNI